MNAGSSCSEDTEIIGIAPAGSCPNSSSQQKQGEQGQTADRLPASNHDLVAPMNLSPWYDAEYSVHEGAMETAREHGVTHGETRVSMGKFVEGPINRVPGQI